MEPKVYILDNIKLHQASNFAYFDFDGTLTKYDTFFIFILYTCGISKVLWHSIHLIYILLLKCFKLISNQQAKQRVLTLMLKGKPKKWLESKSKRFVQTKLTKHIQPNIYNLLLKHIKQDDAVFIISANLDIFLIEWAKLHNVTALIATNLEFKDGVFTGNLASNNCFGIEKLNRLQIFIQANNINVQYSYAYGNSKGDYELLNHAHEGFFIKNSAITMWANHPNARL